MAFGSQAGSANNNRQAHLATAYQELGNELSRSDCKVVGGYTLGRVIGEGTFGSVFMATHRLTGSRCAIKRIPKSLTSQVTREIHHHRRLHHLHIVQLYEIIATETHVWLVTELCSGGELFDYLVEKGRMLEGEARRLFGELTVALGYMHREGVVHRDLKLENVLLDGELRVKLGDLGFAREWAKGKLMETFCGTTGYASPEMLAGKKYLGVETDLWSMGIILYILLCGGLPFDDDDERVMKELILSGTYDEPEWLSEPAKDLIRRLLSQDPQSRPSIENILAHPWFSMTITDNLPLHPGSVPPSPMPDAVPSSSTAPNGVTSGASTTSGAGNDMKRIHSGEFSHTEKALEAMHDRSVSFDDASLQLPLASNSRTPSRTKRRSVSSTMSLERRASTSGTTYHPVDYASMLKAERKAHFTTSSEKRLLEKLASSYIDTGQLMHSVETDACDVSSAMWWFLRARQKDEEEDRPPSRRETRRKNGNGNGNGNGHGLETSNGHGHEHGGDGEAVKEDQPERPAVAREEGVWVKEKEKLDQPRSRERDEFLTPASAGAEIENSRGPSPTDTRATTPRAKPVTAALSVPTPAAARDAPSTPTRDTPAGDKVSPENSPRDRNALKTRSPSMSMLQRATSALLGKSADDDLAHSPTKLQKAPPLPTVDLNERDTIENARPATSNAQAQGQTKSLDLLRDDKKEREREKERDRERKAKRESMWTSWTSFRQFFNDGSIRRKHRDAGGPGSGDKPTMVLSRGIAARAPHANRIAITNTTSTRRASVERPGYSRRSSSVNSRRSSISVIEPSRLLGHHHQADNAALGVGGGGVAVGAGVGVGLYRRSSHRSHGSQTPTSDREFEYPSRPDSATSLRRRDSQRSGISAMRSPSIQSDTSATTPRASRQGMPLSPLHNYQRRPPQGTASTRIRHIRVIPESQLLRSNSVASSIQSNPSSRASSIHEDDESVHSITHTHHYHHHSSHGHNRRRKDSESLARQIHRRASPLVQAQYSSDDSGSRRSSLGGYQNPHHYRTRPRKPKTQLRDVFQKDDEWVDEDEHRFVGGLGQSSSVSRINGTGASSASMASSAWIDGQRTSLANLPSASYTFGSAGTAGAGASSGSASNSSNSRRNKFPSMSGGLNLGQSVKKGPAAIVEEVVEEEEPAPGQGQGSGQNPGHGQGQRLVQPQPVQAQRRGVPPGRAQPAIIQEEEEEEE